MAELRSDAAERESLLPMPVMRGEIVYLSNLYAFPTLRGVSACPRCTGRPSNLGPPQIYRSSGLSLVPSPSLIHNLAPVRSSSTYNSLCLRFYRSTADVIRSLLSPMSTTLPSTPGGLSREGDSLVSDASIGPPSYTKAWGEIWQDLTCPPSSAHGIIRHWKEGLPRRSAWARAIS